MPGQARAGFGQEKLKWQRAEFFNAGWIQDGKSGLKSRSCMCDSKDGLVHSEGLSVYPGGVLGDVGGIIKSWHWHVRIKIESFFSFRSQFLLRLSSHIVFWFSRSAIWLLVQQGSLWALATLIFRSR